MEFLQQLWIPIVASAAILWVASFFLHMVSPHHKGEWKGMPGEQGVVDAITAAGLKPGQYWFPWGEMADMKNPEYMEKLKRGPNGTLVIWPGPVNMGRNLVLMLLFYLLAGVFVAYVSWYSLGAGSHPYLHVFRIAGATAVAAHCLGWMPNMIWFGGTTRCFWTYLFDGIVYGLLTAGTFGWLWLK